MRTLISFSMLLLLVGCGTPNREDAFVNQVHLYKTPGGNAWVLNETGKTRFVLIHGLGQDQEQWWFAPGSWFVEKLLAENYQVVFIDLPHTHDPSSYQALKDSLTPSYASEFFANFDAVNSYCDAEFGRAGHLVVAGISWGGLHALMAATEARVDAWAVFIPVVHIGALRGFENYEQDNFNPMLQESVLASKPGFMYWGGEDEAVYSSEQSAFAASQGALFNANYNPSWGHWLWSPMFDLAKTWMDSLSLN